MLTPKSGLLAAAILTALASFTAATAHAAVLSQSRAYPFPVSQTASGHAKGRILVQPRAGLPASQFAAILKSKGAGAARKIGQSNLHVVQLPAGQSEAGMVERLSVHPGIKFAELDRRVPIHAIPNDPYFGSAYHLSLVGAPTAWDTTSGAGVTIAILDSGVDSAHPDLMPNLIAGYNTYDNNTDTADVCGHGTAVAGTASAATNNGIGVAGVAGQARIMPIRIAYKDPADGKCYGYYSTIANGLTYAADHGARVANVSYGGVAGSSAIISAAQYMQSKGGLVFVSAGNNGIDERITPTTSMIVVSATDQNDKRPGWSSYGSFVSLAAPGEYIYTTTNGREYGAWSGTSFSSPLAAGVAALAMAANPNLPGSDIEKILYSTAKDLETAGRDMYTGYGRVDAARAVEMARASLPVRDTTPPTAAITSPSAYTTVSGVVSVNVSAQDNVGVASVELKVNGTTIATDSAAPYAFAWDSTGVANGMAELSAIAYDAAGNAKSSSVVAVNVANARIDPVADTTAPVVRISNPVAGFVSGTVTVATDATDNNGAAGISQTIYIDGVARASGTGSTVSYSWNTKKVSAGTHTVSVVAKDRAGNTSQSSVAVTVGSVSGKPSSKVGLR